MSVIAGLNAKSGRRDCVDVQVVGSPTPGSGWLPSIGVTRWLDLLPTEPTVIDDREPIRYSANTFHCCVNCGRRFGSQARTTPDGRSSACSPSKPVAMLAAPV